MTNKPDTPVPVPVDKHFLDHIKVGAKLFHYPMKGSAERSFEKSAPTDHTMYSVTDLSAENDIVMVKSFDTGELPYTFSRTELLAGNWWHIPVTQ